MANPKKRLSTNVEGEFFVDSSCINCDTCRQLAPSVFDEKDGYSFVINQPSDTEEVLQTMRAVIACPTGSIGHGDGHDRQNIRHEFPLQLDDGLYYLGFHSAKSFGGASYFVNHNNENWMIDSPRYTTHLVNKLRKLGGVDYIFLTHQDDVADADKYASEFEAERIIHYHDRNAQPEAEIVLKGYDDQEFSKGFWIIPSPGHTKGHIILLVDNRYLFTGDHLYWKEDWNGLRATRRMNWYSWPKQKESLRKLLRYEFEWVLPGHGRRKQLTTDKMKRELEILLNKVQDPNYW